MLGCSPLAGGTQKLWWPTGARHAGGGGVAGSAQVGFPEPRSQAFTPEDVAALFINKFFAQVRPGLWEAAGGGSWEFAVDKNLASQVAHTLGAYIPLFLFYFFNV